MGAKPGKRSSSSLRVRVCGKDGLVAQLLHPDWIARDDAKAVGSNLRAVEDELTRVNAQAKLVLSGGGLLEVYWDATLSHKSWRSEATLNTLVDQVHASVQPILNALASAKRDYVIGVDVFDKNDIGGGQFAVVLNKGTIKAIAWKSYPVLQESNWLAGFGTLKGRQSPRVLSTALGTTAVLVCHDVQAYNHRNQALVDLEAVGVRTYISEPDRGRRNWKDHPEARDAVYRNRRRIRGARGKRLLRQRGERLERPFAHLYETGRMRRVHLRGHDNILKRVLD